MKIALIVTANNEHQLAEMATFLHLSGLEQEPCEIWLAVGEPPIIAENILAAIEARYREDPKDMLLFACGVRGTELATRLAARLKGDAFCGVIRGEFDAQPQFIRPIYGNALTGSFIAGEKPWCISVARALRSEGISANYPQIVLPVSATPPVWLADIQQLENLPCPALNKAQCVIAVGQGVASLQNMDCVKELGQQIGAETGASRQVVMNAWCEMDRLIGMSGAVIAPEICIAAGVSGASAFSAGIRGSRLIVTINNDPDAAIFSEADVMIVDEMMPVLEALAKCVAAEDSD